MRDHHLTVDLLDLLCCAVRRVGAIYSGNESKKTTLNYPTLLAAVEQTTSSATGQQYAHELRSDQNVEHSCALHFRRGASAWEVLVSFLTNNYNVFFQTRPINQLIMGKYPLGCTCKIGQSDVIPDDYGQVVRH